VRYFLHPSYKPNDIVDVAEPPFYLTRKGWGEFPIRLQLHFVDPERNKPVSYIHVIKLGNTKLNRYVFGSERPYDVELDRNTNFMMNADTQAREETDSDVSMEDSVNLDEILALYIGQCPLQDVKRFVDLEATTQAKLEV
jgi:transcription initiation factor IIF auxiliary subunit